MTAKTEIDRLKQSGELGRLRYVRISMPDGDWIQDGFTDLVQTDDPVPDSPRDVTESWGDPYFGFINYYIHQVNLLRHLLGEPYRVTHADRAGVLLVAETDSDATGVIEMKAYSTTRDWQESALVCFEKGYVRLELPAPLALNRPGRVTFFRDPGNDATPETVSPTLPAVHAMRQQAINFVRAIRGEIRPLCEAAEALEDLKVAGEYMGLKSAR
jgi:predicted dehydrogenase